MFFFDEIQTIAANRKEINFGAPVLQGEVGSQDGNQCRAPAFRGHSFAACIHFLVDGQAESSPLRLRSGHYRRVLPTGLRWPRVIPTLAFL
jgi:hypothetical protein